MTDLALVDIRWTSEDGVRWGRMDVGGFAEPVGDGGVLGGVVEIGRMLVVWVGWYTLDKRWSGTRRTAVTDWRVVDLGMIFVV